MSSLKSTRFYDVCTYECILRKLTKMLPSDEWAPHAGYGLIVCRTFCPLAFALFGRVADFDVASRINMKPELLMSAILHVTTISWKGRNARRLFPFAKRIRIRRSNHDRYATTTRFQGFPMNFIDKLLGAILS